MRPKIDSWKRQTIFYRATFPILGRNNYERMNSRLERQIRIREEKRKKSIVSNKNRQLYPFYEGKPVVAGSFFDK